VISEPSLQAELRSHGLMVLDELSDRFRRAISTEGSARWWWLTGP
jgi:hypothetical protein